MNSKPSTRTCADGLSLVELLVALTVTGAIGGAVLTVALSSRGMLQTDEHRTTINQNLRAGIDLLGIDVRQTGERLPWDIPAIEIVDGASGAADELHIRRNGLDVVLPVCMDLKAGSADDAVFIAEKRGGPRVRAGCLPVEDSDNDGWPDNLQVWRDYRIAAGGTATAYIYNPAAQAGEFFTYDAEDNSTFHVHRMNPGTWANDYNVDEGSRVYILEERSYRLQDDILQAVINANAPLNLVTNITDFQLTAYMNGGTPQSALGPGDDWTAIESIEVTLVGESSFRQRTMQRTLSTRLFPRNILSQR